MLALAAVLFQHQLQEEEEADHKRLQMVRQQRIQHMKQRRPSTETAPLSKRVKSPAAPKDKTDVKSQEWNDVKPTATSGSAEQPITAKESKAVKPVVDTQSTPAKTSRKPVKKATPKAAKRVLKKKRRPKKAPKVEIVDPFANP
jgi:hypothetical protein